ncbi:putative protein family UPF0642 [Metarhizium album ARSEF 1941]|uniref:DUF2423 domain-containing protein n=1 Tax=Metarhizium album (strain ARSEF 1941) TaxID=1081103 RepID=A0A0B2WW40_METAS|nr:putative protein family UPF0642 [Metarhizium album ARSEF 1941]KHN97667.1 putative protein family UPF0642 [Metarhizium album ARSEF 1941]
MAKSSRSSSRKENNRRKAASVFSPAEVARNERLSTKLLELARQPKPESSDANMDTNAADDVVEDIDSAQPGNDIAGSVMEVDSKPPKLRIGKKRIDKRRQKKSGIVFARYSDRLAKKKKKGSR